MSKLTKLDCKKLALEEVQEQKLNYYHLS